MRQQVSVQNRVSAAVQMISSVSLGPLITVMFLSVYPVDGRELDISAESRGFYVLCLVDSSVSLISLLFWVEWLNLWSLCCLPSVSLLEDWGFGRARRRNKQKGRQTKWSEFERILKSLACVHTLSHTLWLCPMKVKHCWIAFLNVNSHGANWLWRCVFPLIFPQILLHARKTTHLVKTIFTEQRAHGLYLGVWDCGSCVCCFPMLCVSLSRECW